MTGRHRMTETSSSRKAFLRMNRTKIVVLLTLLALGASLASACSDTTADRAAASSSTAAPSTTAAHRSATYTAPPATTRAAARHTGVDQIFVDYIDSKRIHYSSEGALIRMGHATCDVFDAGATFAQVLTTATSGTGYTTKDAATLIGASLAAYCPQHRSIVEAATR